MAQIATTIEQSKKLIELGIDVNTADMNYCNSSYKGKDYVGEWKLSLQSPQEAKSILDMSVTSWNTYWEIIPAWSLSALIELMPASIIYGYSEDDLYLLNIYKDDYRYFVEYRKEIKSKISNCYKTKFEESSENLIDALFNVTCHLLENKLI